MTATAPILTRSRKPSDSLSATSPAIRMCLMMIATVMARPARAFQVGNPSGRVERVWTCSRLLPCVDQSQEILVDPVPLLVQIDRTDSHLVASDFEPAKLVVEGRLRRWV